MYPSFDRSRFCDACGAEVLRAGARFCRVCGHCLLTADPPAPEAPWGSPPRGAAGVPWTGPAVDPPRAEWRKPPQPPELAPRAANALYPPHAKPVAQRAHGLIRHPVGVVLLSVLTLGLYVPCWMALLWSESRRYANGRRGVGIMSGFAALAAYALLPLGLVGGGFAVASGVSRSNSCQHGHSVSRFYADSRAYEYRSYRPSPRAGFVVAAPAFILAIVLAFAGAVGTPGLVRRMRLADGVSPHDAGHPGAHVLWLFVPYIGALLWLGMTQHAINNFWRYEAR